MRVWMLWNGGANYASFDQFDRRQCEEFPSIKAAVEDFDDRPDDPYYPCVERVTPDEGGPEAWLCFSDPYQVGDLYPDRVIKYGPRGGLIVERA